MRSIVRLLDVLCMYGCVLFSCVDLFTDACVSCRTYPGQSGINPLPMDWGHKDPQERGPVVVSRTQTTIRRRNGMLLNLDSTDDILANSVCSYWR